MMTFDEGRLMVCPKCGSEDKDREYWSPPLVYGNAQPYGRFNEDESMVWRCLDCRYTWRSYTKDHKGETA